MRLLLLALGALLASTLAAQAQVCVLPVPGTTQRMTIGTTGRTVLVHTPDEPADGPLPLVFVLHGSGGDGAAILKQSKLEAASDRHGFLLVAPDAGIPVERGFVWNIPGVPTVTGKVPEPGDADDVAFLKAVIDFLANQGCADRSRVYATGLSGGGRMTSWLGCVAADRFAAIAPVVGLRAGNPLASDPTRPDPATCRPTAPMPVIAFAGDADKVNPVEGGGAGYWQYRMAVAETRWAELNGCRAGPLRRYLAADRYERLHTSCREQAEVVAHVTRGAGHVWTADNDAMWAFFARHRRPAIRPRPPRGSD
ncbi:MAG: polyhydroxybutyrate depolymerase [Alphaproteobacteria bacterium HGW-Alphaproteobacteria-16]|nr:MAG: polyhydroxybutyrate depolymerase [Alphaproteobacteria bacterium HGW-Alphaproteobacteria-16]